VCTLYTTQSDDRGRHTSMPQFTLCKGLGQCPRLFWCVEQVTCTDAAYSLLSTEANADTLIRSLVFFLFFLLLPHCTIPSRELKHCDVAHFTTHTLPTALVWHTHTHTHTRSLITVSLFVDCLFVTIFLLAYRCFCTWCRCLYHKKKGVLRQWLGVR
jgi:hypothetical protein